MLFVVPDQVWRRIKALVNTYTTMCAMSNLVKRIDPLVFLTMGDDSVAISELDTNLHGMEFDLADRFNMPTKMSKLSVGSFCSIFLIELADRWIYATDIVKRIEKLGRQHNPDVMKLIEQCVSFKDLLACYGNAEVRQVAAVKTALRYDVLLLPK